MTPLDKIDPANFYVYDGSVILALREIVRTIDDKLTRDLIEGLLVKAEEFNP